LSFDEKVHVSSMTSSIANDCDRLPPSFNDVQVIELDPGSWECPYDVLKWHSYADASILLA
jgi:hypothetical protein